MLSQVNKVKLIFFLYIAIFALFWSILSVETFIVVLNGLFIGAMVSVLTAFSPLTWNALKGRLLFYDATEMALGVAFLILGIILGVGNSSYMRGAGIDVPSSVVTAMGRYTVIYGAVLIVYAPGVGLSFFEGRDRKVALIALSVGFLVAVSVVAVQRWELLQYVRP